MRKYTRTAVAVAAGAALITTAAACSSSGGSPVVPKTQLTKGGTTSVALDSNFVKALTSLKVTPAPTGTAKVSSAGVASFPITGGNVTIYKKGDVNPYVQGVVDHEGSGLSLTAGSTTVTLQNFVVNPGKDSNLTGEVLANGKVAYKSTRLFDLDGSTLKTPTVANGVATLTGTRVLLNSGAAAALNKAFGINALKGGLLIGVATIKANA